MIKNIKLKIIIGGMLGITIISIIALLLVDTVQFGDYIVAFDVFGILLWIVVGNYIANDYIKTMKKYEKGN